jgi:hypothetical protein
MSAKVETAAPAPLIYAKISAVMASLSAISKDRQNDQQRYKFRGIDDAMNALHGPLSTNGVFYAAAVRDVRQREYATKSGTAMLHVMLTVAYTFYAADGSSVTFEAVGEASDSGDKAAGKAQAYALKVALLQLFCIPTEEQKDTEYQHPERAAVSQEPVLPAPSLADWHAALEAATSTLELRDIWKKVPTAYAEKLLPVKDAQKAFIDETVAADAAGMTLEQYRNQPAAA